jgi:hypothetical protein
LEVEYHSSVDPYSRPCALELCFYRLPAVTYVEHILCSFLLFSLAYIYLYSTVLTFLLRFISTLLTVAFIDIFLLRKLHSLNFASGVLTFE